VADLRVKAVVTVNAVIANVVETVAEIVVQGIRNNKGIKVLIIL
jgi:hypothetical protein